MRVLVGMEASGVVREAFRARGHEAWSCDLRPAEDESLYHIIDDVENVLHLDWDLAIFHPDCTYMARAGLHWNKRDPSRVLLTEASLAQVQRLMDAPIDKIAIENPIGVISTRIRKPNQIIKPYNFGHDASKLTCLWLKNLPLLRRTSFVPGRIVTDPKTGKTVERWANQLDDGQNKLGQSKDRWRLRSLTYQGIAEAMATQWG